MAGEGGGIQVQQQSEAVTHQSLACSVQEKAVEAEATLCTVLSQGQSEGEDNSTSGRERSQAR